jgi:hypothetical protein
MHELDLAFEERPPHDSANPHPFGQIPALVDRDEAAPFGRVFESGAILAYLGDAFDPNLRASPARRADALKWIVWANASLDPCLFVEDARGRVLDSGARAKEPPRTLLRLEAWLAGGGGGGEGEEAPSESGSPGRASAASSARRTSRWGRTFSLSRSSSGTCPSRGSRASPRTWRGARRGPRTRERSDEKPPTR